MTVDNVIKVINKTEGDKVKVMGGFGVPKSLLEEIETRYSTDSEKSHAYADYYVRLHADASWEHLTKRMCHMKELAAAKESKSHMSTGKYTARAMKL